MKKRILLVEDDARFREAFTSALKLALAPEQLDVGFVEAGSLAEARARLREGGLDAALIDVTLPDGNGLDLVREINDGIVIPTLVLTAYMNPKVAAPCDGGRRSGSDLQGGFGGGDRGRDQEAEQRLTL